MKLSHENPLAYRLLIAGFSLLGVAVFLASMIKFAGRMTFDDAYIFIRYAKHWLAGYGFCWNIADGPVYGCTSTLFLFLVTLCKAIANPSDTVLLATLSIFFGMCALIVMIGTSFMLCSNTFAKKTWLPLIVLPVIALGDAFRYHAVTGMETTLALLCNALLVTGTILYTRRPRFPALLLCAALGYASYLTRPENGVYMMLVPPLFFLALDRTLKRHAIRYIGLCFAFLLADALLKKAIFGDIIPLPFFVKTNGFYRGYAGGDVFHTIKYLLKFLQEAFPFFLALLFLTTRSSLRIILAFLIPVAIGTGYFFTVTQIMGFAGRFYYPSVPFIVAAAVYACNNYIEKKSGADSGAVHFLPLRLVCAALLIFVTYSITFKRATVSAWDAITAHTNTRFSAQTQYSTSSGVKTSYFGGHKVFSDMVAFLRTLPPEVSLAGSEYGYVGAQLPDLKIIDLAGLNDRAMALQGFSAHRLFAARPDIIWMPHTDYTAIHASVLDNPVFKEQYWYYPDIFILGIAVYKQSPHAGIILSQLEKSFCKAYPGLEFSECLGERIRK